MFKNSDSRRRMLLILAMVLCVMILCVIGYGVARVMKKERQRPESVTLPNGKVAIFFEAGDRNPFGITSISNSCPVAAVNSDHQCSGDCRDELLKRETTPREKITKMEWREEDKTLHIEFEPLIEPQADVTSATSSAPPQGN